MNKLISQKIENILIEIAKRLKQEDIDWVLTGSLNLAIQGINAFKGHDIDIVVLPSDLKRAEKVFKDNLLYNIKEKGSLKNDGTKFKTFKFKIKRVEIEVFTTDKDLHPENLNKNKKDLIKKRLGGYKIFCYPLKIEKRAYKKLNRPKKVEKIKNALNNK